MHDQTRYPERYQRSDESPDFFRYRQRPATLLGRDLSTVIGIDGTIIAAKQLLSEGDRYWLDPDLSLRGQSGVVHYIWLCDQWQLFEVKHFHSDRIRRAQDIEQAFATEEG